MFFLPSSTYFIYGGHILKKQKKTTQSSQQQANQERTRRLPTPSVDNILKPSSKRVPVGFLCFMLFLFMVYFLIYLFVEADEEVGG